MTTFTPRDIPRLYKKHGSLSAICREEGVTYSYMHHRYTKAVKAGLIDPLDMGAKPRDQFKNPTVKQRVKALKTKKDDHHTYILTCAQNNTDVHEKTWLNLLALAHHTGAKLLVSQFMYGKRGLGSLNDKARLNRVSAVHAPVEEVWYDPRIVPFISNDRIEIAKGLVWCGELNIIPTAVSPLTGLEGFTGRKSMIAPHVTQQLACVASYGEGDGAKLNYCTGTVTQRNYIQRKEGLKAEFHHTYGALFVEVDEVGHWWVRQLNADSDGVIYHIDGDDGVIQVKDGEIMGGRRSLSVTSGDTHEDEKDPVVHTAKYRKGGMVDVLKPQYNFIHDVLNFARRSHHNVKDPYFMIEQFVQKRESVEEEVAGVRAFLQEIKRTDCLTVVVDSNHDRHLDRWLSENDGRKDPVNARYWSVLNKYKIDCLYSGLTRSILPAAIADWDSAWAARWNVKFLEEDEGFITVKWSSGGIENGMHGDRAANGARGNIRSFAKMGRRSNVGHSHTCGIFQGCYMAGTNSKLKLRYNHGASSWTQSDIVTFENGKRCIVTFAFGKWHA